MEVVYEKKNCKELTRGRYFIHADGYLAHYIVPAKIIKFYDFLFNLVSDKLTLLKQIGDMFAYELFQKYAGVFHFRDDMPKILSVGDTILLNTKSVFNVVNLKNDTAFEQKKMCMENISSDLSSTFVHKGIVYHLARALNDCYISCFVHTTEKAAFKKETHLYLGERSGKYAVCLSPLHNELDNYEATMFVIKDNIIKQFPCKYKFI